MNRPPTDDIPELLATLDQQLTDPGCMWSTSTDHCTRPATQVGFCQACGKHLISLCHGHQQSLALFGLAACRSCGAHGVPARIVTWRSVFVGRSRS